MWYHPGANGGAECSLPALHNPAGKESAMPEAERASEQLGGEEGPEDFGHPRGTLAIVIVFGALFGLGWLAMYLFLFLARGGLRP